MPISESLFSSFICLIKEKLFKSAIYQVKMHKLTCILSFVQCRAPDKCEFYVPLVVSVKNQKKEALIALKRSHHNFDEDRQLFKD